MGSTTSIVTSQSVAADDSWLQSDSIDVANQHILGIDVDVNSSSLVSVTDESISFTTENLEHDTGHMFLEGGTVVITTTDGLTTFTEDVDYTVDYTNGTITFVDSGTSGWANDGTTYYLDYDYTPILTGDIVIKAVKSLDGTNFESNNSGEILKILSDIDKNGSSAVITIPVLGVEKVKVYIENKDTLYDVNVDVSSRNTIL